MLRSGKIVRMQTVGILALAAAAAVAPGCGEGTMPVDDEADVQWGTGGHMLPLRNPGEVTPQSLTEAATSAKLVYYGGHIIGAAKVVQVLYGSGTYLPAISTGTGTGSIPDFYSAVLASPYMDWLTEYNTTSPKQSIGHGTFVKRVSITPSSAHNGSTISDASIQAELNTNIASGKLPANDGNTIYMVYFPKGKKINLGGAGSCVAGGFCAYHGTFKRSSTEVFYGVMPDFSAGSGCDTGCGTSNQFGNTTSVSSHELIETITDSEVGLATILGKPLAWYDSVNGEIGDICNAEQGSAAGYVVQKEWSNKSNACRDH